MVERLLSAVQAFYYGIWANLGEIPLVYRALIVVFVAVCLIWFIVRPIFLKLLSRLMRLLALGTKGSCLLGELLLSPLSKWAPERYLRMCNRWNAAMGKCHTWLTGRAERAVKVEPHIGRAFLVYAALVILISLPSWTKFFISEQYIPYLSYVSQFYQRLEAPALQTAMAYEPLFIMPGQGAGPPNQDTAPSEEVLASEPAESAPEEIWLSLSSKGRKGTNVRKGPGKSYRVIAVISGDEQVLYLGDQEKGWLHIRRADGTEGWISQKLLTPLPEEGSVESETP